MFKMMPPQNGIGFDYNTNIELINSEDFQEPSLTDERAALGTEASLIENAEVVEGQMVDDQDIEDESPEQTEFDLLAFYQDLDLPNFQTYSAENALKAYQAGGRFQSKSYKEMLDKCDYEHKNRVQKGMPSGTKRNHKNHYEPYADAKKAKKQSQEEHSAEINVVEHQETMKEHEWIRLRE